MQKVTLPKNKKLKLLKTLLHFQQLSDACGNADLIVEAATENQDLKLKIFKQMDELAPKIVFSLPILHLFLSQKLLRLQSVLKSNRNALYESSSDYEIGRNHQRLFYF